MLALLAIPLWEPIYAHGSCRLSCVCGWVWRREKKVSFFPISLGVPTSCFLAYLQHEWASRQFLLPLCPANHSNMVGRAQRKEVGCVLIHLPSSSPANSTSPPGTKVSGKQTKKMTVIHLHCSIVALCKGGA